MRLSPLVSAALGLALWLGTGAVPAAADAVGFTIRDPAVTTPTGLAGDAMRGLYWTTNQTGARIYGLDQTGVTQRVVSWDAKPVNIQAVSVARGFVYVGDIGDPRGTRQSITVYRPGSLRDQQTVTYRAWELTYPDGPHDAAAMAVSPKGNIYIVTRGNQPGIYRASGDLSTQEPNVLRRVSDAPAWVTDATFLSDGARIAMRTYTGLIVYDAFTFKQVASAPLPKQGGGEGLAVSLDSTALMVADKAKGAAVLTVPIPTTTTKLAAAPSVAPSIPTPTPSPTPTTQPTAQATVAPAESDSSGSDATMLALAGAIVVAVGAGIVSAVKR